jgi:hypothetical protein
MLPTQHHPLNTTTPEIPQNLHKSKPKTKPNFPLRPLLTLLLLPLALAPIITLSSVAELASQSYIRGLDCYPNRAWKLSRSASWRIMDSSYMFTPNLSFGSMTFTQVKAIDVAWDLLVGRGGQVALAWVNWRVCGEWLAAHMERWHTGWRVYAALAFEANTLPTLGVLCTDMFAATQGSKRTWFWRRVAVLGIVLSTLYVLSFPTLMAAMTGYIAKSKPYVQDGQGNLIAFEKVERMVYGVQDAARVWSEGALVVGERDEEMRGAVENCEFAHEQRRLWYHTDRQ